MMASINENVLGAEVGEVEMGSEDDV